MSYPEGTQETTTVMKMYIPAQSPPCTCWHNYITNIFTLLHMFYSYIGNSKMCVCMTSPQKSWINQSAFHYYFKDNSFGYCLKKSNHWQHHCSTSSGLQQRKHQRFPLLCLCDENRLVTSMIWNVFPCHDIAMKQWKFTQMPTVTSG